MFDEKRPVMTMFWEHTTIIAQGKVNRNDDCPLWDCIEMDFLYFDLVGMDFQSSHGIRINKIHLKIYFLLHAHFSRKGVCPFMVGKNPQTLFHAV